MKKIILVLSLIISSLLLVACNKNSYQKIFDSSLDASTNVTINYEITDNDIIFYTSSISYDFSDKCYENINTKTYSETFKEVTSSKSYEHENYKKSDYLNLNLTDELLNDLDKGDTITFKVLKDDVKKFFNNELEVTSDLAVSMIVENDLIKTLVCTYCDDTKVSVITITMSY